jgi:hypothetical protein
MAGADIHTGHAGAIPDEAGPIHSKKHQEEHSSDSSEDERRMPGAFIWDKIKHKK